MEIKDILNNSRGEDLSYILQEKISRMEANIQKERELIQRMREHSFAQGEEYVENTYAINTATVAGQLIASIRFTGRYQDLDLYIPYHDEECKEAADIELCIPVKKEIHHPLLTCRYLEKLHALHTTHHGGYDTLWIAYKALFAYANDQGIRILTPSREDYVKGPGMLFRGNPDAYVTEIYLPFAREENRR